MDILFFEIGKYFWSTIKLILLGSITLILLQIITHIGVNISFFPTTGMTLPFLSYGGSSIIGTSIIAGIISIFHQQLDRLEQFKKNPNLFLKGVPRDYLSKLKIKAKKISPPQIKNLRKKIADLDRDFKTGKAEFWTEFRKLIINLGYI